MAPTPAGSGTKHKYTKENKVGEGTYAIVYLGRQSGTNRRVAIKAIRIGGFKDGPSDLTTSRLIAGMDMSAVREIKYMQELHHENITEVFEPWEVGVTGF
jgi:cyclin-dependent kinase 7